MFPTMLTTKAPCSPCLALLLCRGCDLANPAVGECFVVTGLGLVGLLTVQVLRANGCRVLGIDLDASRLALAQRFGIETVDLSAGEDPVARAIAFSRGRGVDGVLLATSTASNDPISDAARMCRKRGRVVLIGVTGLDLKRSDFYEKELTFQVSCSYGPGRYDPAYEDQGHDYPIGFVRWTEQRNFEAVLDMMVDGRIDVKPLISHRFPNRASTGRLCRADEKQGLRLASCSNTPAEGAARDHAETRTRATDYPTVASCGRGEGKLSRFRQLRDAHFDAGLQGGWRAAVERSL